MNIEDLKTEMEEAIKIVLKIAMPIGVEASKDSLHDRTNVQRMDNG